MFGFKETPSPYSIQGGGGGKDISRNHTSSATPVIYMRISFHPVPNKTQGFEPHFETEAKGSFKECLFNYCLIFALVSNFKIQRSTFLS